MSMQPRHFPVRRFDRDAPTRNLLTETRLGDRVLYRFYDADRQPLYIGITHTGDARLAAHRRRSEWWPQAEYIAVSVYRNWAALEEAELAAIRAEHPPFNKAKTLWRQQVLLRLDAAPEAVAAELHRIGRPEFIRELARLLSQPERYPQPVPPPSAFPVEEG
jgi:predicted GIY-YIG superfamily endonuclease